ncbi:I78 family peptidase inhibitor [Pseudomonas borbori]|uniref:Peptidase inhibitor I78 family protein n=1 Tax=Pseudomonas borbori TaxID=289003 RepID=A0A1I5U308_9PSED|nr:I78 family peptidase inhibitor [Pseudomonas borbori]SFP89688.1 Peptidase inhibitor I78 family protein [Pseudomonas borbori]
MLFRHIPASLALLALLAACSSVDKPAAPDATCRAEAVPGLLGKLATAERVEMAREQTGAKSVRVLAPGDAATMDYNPQRLNIEIDEAELIQRISCG